jgi:hypothetical protein
MNSRNVLKINKRNVLLRKLENNLNKRFRNRNKLNKFYKIKLKINNKNKKNYRINIKKF